VVLGRVFANLVASWSLLIGLHRRGSFLVLLCHTCLLYRSPFISYFVASLVKRS
jgi:hypothetical protein